MSASGKNILENVKQNHQVFLNYLKAKFPVFHNSNIFFRDLQYGLKGFFEMMNQSLSYPEAEELAKEIGNYFEQKGIFIRVNNLGWKLNYPEFVTTAPGDPL